MKFTLAWLKDHLDTDASLDDVVDALTMVGLEVENVVDPAKALGTFRIAKVLSAEKHPNADKLQVLRVATGDGEPIQVVCGAPNARAGLVGVFAAPGAYVPGIDVTLSVGNIRGVESHGMMCSERELELSDEHSGIIDLPSDAPIGARFIDYADLADPMIEIAITPNRPDCLGVRGIARDLAARGLGRLKEETITPFHSGFECPVPIALDFPEDKADACPVFAGRIVKGVKNVPSPTWMQKRLRAIGLRPISALVDITNYISYDHGRPLHVYDVSKLTGTVRARLGKAGESFVALDGKTYEVDEEMTVIADDARVLGLGGVMGGEYSGVTEETTEVLIESAYFDPNRTARTGRRTGINSDARYRFERGIDPAFVIEGLELATRYVTELCGGDPSRSIVAGNQPIVDRAIDLPLSEVKRLSGLDVPVTEINVILKMLGFWVSGMGDTVKVAVPSWRPDVHGKADLVEEVVRIAGVDRVKPTPLPGSEVVGQKVLTPIQIRTRRSKRALAARGLVEAVTWSFLSKLQADMFGGGAPELALANPISSEMSDMRPSLLPGLIAAAGRNADRGFNDVALFEVGQIFKGDKPEEQFIAATGIRKGTAVISGDGRHWSGNAPVVDVFDAKADALAVLESAGMDTSKVQVVKGAPSWFHPGRSGTIQLGPKVVLGHFGELHPGALEKLDVAGPIVGFEVILDNVPLPKAKPTKAKPPLAASDLMPVKRDFAFIVDDTVEAARIIRAAQGAAKQAIGAVNIFDVYRGEHVGEGQKSVAIEVTLVPQGKTFTDEEIEKLGQDVVAAVSKATGATLRG
ncbi:Phenylalanine-tRNA ligase beta subunit [Hartmannibacter diazotrophicus]|uniref:Phenylalanine--tRNA ligase beta subunit n=1 Tax=Hartmannibacter diazotrophicus TaxID=1482074 RepID=A0A2C9D2Y7_9HYPH|nr:phenylalanine--tRNA ligase subunit beta [Hartmannibacter diazotrophicus]SON54141.1 Phenylalanine-tRNA ligase beta subunit [Hartmannibacter diazotrophicus]